MGILLLNAYIAYIALYGYNKFSIQAFITFITAYVQLTSMTIGMATSNMMMQQTPMKASFR